MPRRRLAADGGRRVDAVLVFDVAMLLLASLDTLHTLTRTILLHDGGG